MPLYEYLCEECSGIFEVVRPIREAPEPQPCPECDEECERVMPTSFSAFVMRQGYPRRIPDKGTYWHLGQEVTFLPKKARPYEHPQVTKRREQERWGLRTTPTWWIARSATVGWRGRIGARNVS